MFVAFSSKSNFDPFEDYPYGPTTWSFPRKDVSAVARKSPFFFNRRWLWTEDNFQRRQDEVTSHQHDLDELQLDCRCG